MFFHHIKIRSCDPHPIMAEEYENMHTRLSKFQIPLTQMPFYQMLCDQAHPFSKKQTIEEFELPLSRNLFGLYETIVAVNGVKFRFLIDTGAQISGIRKRCCEQLHLEKIPGDLEIGSVGATKMKLHAVRANRIRLGGVIWNNVPLVLLDEQRFSLPFLRVDLLRFDGILGWDLLSMLDFELDTIEKRMKIVKNRYRFDHRNLLPGSFPSLVVQEPDGKTALFGIDTGAKQSWLGSKYIEKRDLRILSEAKVIGFGVHGREEMVSPIVDRVHLYVDRADIQLYGCISAFVEIYEGCPFDGIFGNEIFAGRRIRFVNSKHTVLLT